MSTQRIQLMTMTIVWDAKHHDLLLQVFIWKNPLHATVEYGHGVHKKLQPQRAGATRPTWLPAACLSSERFNSKCHIPAGALQAVAGTHGRIKTA